MVKVHIHGELIAECSHLLPDRWNGWVEPVFSESQIEFVISECVRLGWISDPEEISREIWELGNDELVVSGWCWEVVGE